MDDEKHQFVHYLNGVVKQEAALRRKHDIGDHYRVLANQFKNILSEVSLVLSAEQTRAVYVDEADGSLMFDQQLVYVHLFNTAGKNMTRWLNILSPRNLIEYSVNRPIYAEEVQVQAYIRSRPQLDEHAYIVIKVDHAAVLSEHAIDPLGQPLLKLKENTLKIEHVIDFVHNGHRYKLRDGQLVLSDRLKKY